MRCQRRKRLPSPKQRRLPYLLAAFTLSLSSYAPASDKSANLHGAGLWTEDSPTVHAITLRRPDGTYRRKVTQIHDYARPPVFYEEQGHWTIDLKHYVFTIKSSTAPFADKDVGKQWHLKVLFLSDTLIRYLSTDGAIVAEKRVGNASDAVFEHLQLRPLDSRRH